MMVALSEVMVRLINPKVKVEPPMTTLVMGELGIGFEDCIELKGSLLSDDVAYNEDLLLRHRS